MKSILTLAALVALSTLGVASQGFASQNTGTIGNKDGTIGAALQAPPNATFNTAATNALDPAGTFTITALLAIPDPTSSTVTSKTEGAIAVNGKKDAGITAGAVNGSPQNTTTVVTNVDIGENTAWTKTNAMHTANAPNPGRQEGSMGLMSALFFGGTGQGVFQHSAWPCHSPLVRAPSFG